MPNRTRSGRASKRIENRDRAARRVAHLRPLPSYEDQALGFMPEQLRGVWADEPAACWDDVRLTALVEATIATFSRLIGQMDTDRRGLGALAREIALAATIGHVTPGVAPSHGARDPDAPVAELRAPYAAAGWERVATLGGWAGGVISWRKLFEYGPVPLELDAGIPLPHELRMLAEDDYAALDQAWQKVAGSTHRRLPAPVLTAFLANPRLVDGVHVPGVIEAGALLLSWGPFGARRAMVRALQMQAEQVGRATLRNYGSLLDSFARAAGETAGAYPVLDELGWAERWLPLKDDVRGIRTRRGDGDTRDSSSPGLLQARRSLRTWERLVDSHRRRDGSLRPAGGRALSNYCLLAVHLSLSARIGMTARVAPADVLRQATIGDYTGPAIWVVVNKDGTLRREPRPVHPHVVDVVDEFCAFFGIARDDTRPLWRDADGHVLSKSTLVYRFTRAGGPRTPVLLDRGDGQPCGSHAGRHLGDQLIRQIATDIVAVRPEFAGRIDAGAAADVWLSHAIRSDRYGYQDVDSNRDWWAVTIGAGDPEYGIPGLGDLLFGDAGARRGWDDERIREFVGHRDAARIALGETERQIAAVRADRDRLGRTPLEIAPRRLTALVGGQALLEELDHTRPATLADLSHQFQRVHDSLAALVREAHEAQVAFAAETTRALDERRRQDRQIDAELDRLLDCRADQRVDVVEAELQLDRLREAGRTLPLADELPTTRELRAASGDPTARAADDESWEEALARIAGAAAPAGQRVRRWTNVAELSLLLGVDSVTLLRWRQHQTASEIARGIARATWVQLGAKLAFAKADTLPLHLLVPSQRALLEAILAQPMGNFGGRHRADSEIEAAWAEQRDGTGAAETLSEPPPSTDGRPPLGDNRGTG